MNSSQVKGCADVNLFPYLYDTLGSNGGREFMCIVCGVQVVCTA